MALPYKQRASSDCFSAAITDQQRPWNTCTEGTEHKAMDTAAVVRVAQPNAVTAASSPLLSQSDSFPFLADDRPPPHSNKHGRHRQHEEELLQQQLGSRSFAH